jgi:putative ABC transport system permease protein
MNTLLEDLRFGLRMLAKKPGLTLIAIVTLALGIGANAAIFSVVNSVLLNPMPYREPQEIVRMFEKVERQAMSSERMEVAPANFLDWQARSHSFSGIAAYGLGNLAMSGDGEAESLAGAFVTAKLFSVLGVKPILGRTFTVEEDKPENEYVALLGYGLWQSRFSGDQDIAGREVTLDGRTYTIIGVMPEGFQFPKQTAIWTPLALNNNQVQMREARFLKIVARLRSDVSLAAARDEMDAIARSLADEYPQTNQNWGVNIVPLLEEEVGRVRQPLLLLLGIVALVLLIACANVANLLMARATARQSEIAIRLALGASRFRIIQQLLAESSILALLGGSAGFLLAMWGVDLLLALAPGNLPRAGEVRLDADVFMFTLIISLATGIIFGLFPALQASKPDLNASLKEGAGKASIGQSRHRALGALVVVEVALATVVLVSTGLLIRSFLLLRQVNTGLNADNVLTVQFTPPSARYNDRERWRENRLSFYNQLIPRIEALPGVEYVGGIDSLPFAGSGRVWRLRKDGEEPAGLAATFQVAMLDYFHAMGIQLKAGRLFNEADRDGAPPVAIINETMARRFWPDESALGKRIVIRNDTAAREIVGIVSDIKHFGLDRDAEPEMYVPFNQRVIDLIPVVIRAKGDPAQLAGAIRQEVQAVDPMVAISKIKTVPELRADSLAERRFTLLLLAIFAGLAMTLSVTGIYSVMSYMVTERTREIGVRMALGANQGDVLNFMIRRGMIPALIGVTAGLGLAFATTRVIESLLYSVSATDPLTLVVVALLLTIVALLACYIPARRATKVDPQVALRYE